MAETIKISELPSGTPTSDDILVFVDRADGITKRADTDELPTSGDMLKSDNLSGLTDIVTARSNLGLGSLSTQSGTFSGTSSGTNTGDNATNSNYTTLATTLATANSWSAVQTFTSPLITNGAINFNAPEGFMVNGKIVPTVASGNLTLTLTGTSASLSATNPCYVMIGGVTRTITSNLTFTMNAGTNWLNLGSTELATKEADLFPYIIDGSGGAYMNLGVCRVPNRTNLSEVAYGSNNEKYMEQAGNSGTENCVNIGRFAATLSAGAGYTWSIPTYTASNLIQRPVYETRWLDWTPTFSGVSPMVWTATATLAKYRIGGNMLSLQVFGDGTTSGTASNGLVSTIPMFPSTGNIYGGGACADGGSQIGATVFIFGSNAMQTFKYDNSSFGIGASRRVRANIFYPI